MSRPIYIGRGANEHQQFPLGVKYLEIAKSCVDNVYVACAINCYFFRAAEITQLLADLTKGAQIFSLHIKNLNTEIAAINNV